MPLGSYRHREKHSIPETLFSFCILILLTRVAQLRIANERFNETAGALTGVCMCDIQNRGTFVSCRSKRLTKVPKCIPIEVKLLNLFDNRISSMPKDVFKEFTNLETLIISHNRITSLQTGIFTGLKRLKTLDLSFNLLKKEDSFSIETFNPLKVIDTLYIQGNCDPNSETQCSYPDTALSKAITLRYLYLDGYKNTKLGSGFKTLKNLKMLQMNGDNGYCKLGQIPQDMFWGLRGTNISFIRLASCGISHIIPNSFAGLSNLQTLVISDDPFWRPEGLRNITIGLNSTSIQTLNLTDLWYNPHVVQFSANMFDGILNTPLEVLNLSGNKILSLDPKCILNLPQSLRYLSLSKNIITNVLSLKNVVHLENIEELDVSFQNYLGSSSTDYVTLSMSDDTTNGLLNYTMKEEGVDLLVAKTVAGTGESQIKLPPKLKILRINNIKLDPYIIPSLSFSMNKLEFINASGCMLSAFSGPLIGLNHLRKLDLSDNDMKTVATSSFDGFGSLIYLYFARNKIGKSILTDKNCKTFRTLTKLQVLDLSDNGIVDLPECIFQSLRSLVTLSLENNALPSITFHLSSLLNLKYLNLANNQIAILPDWVIAEIKTISVSTPLSIDLRGNKLKCDCHNRNWISWFISNDVHIVDRKGILCIYKNDSFAQLSQITEIRNTLRYECDSWIIVTACAIIFVGLTLIFGLISVLCYKKAKYMYLFRSGHRTLNPYHRMKGENIMVKVDAYLSYDRDYEVFGTRTLHQVIADDIYPTLVRKGLRLLIRDELTSGQMLNILISEAVQKCHKVVVFITPEFCKDFANLHEFHVAAHEGIYTNRMMLIPVFVGEVNKSDITVDMLSYLRSEEIAHFPTDEKCMSDFINYLEDRILQW